MSKAYGKTPTFSTSFDFTAIAQKNFVFIVTKQEKIYIVVHVI